MTTPLEDRQARARGWAQVAMLRRIVEDGHEYRKARRNLARLQRAGASPLVISMQRFTCAMLAPLPRSRR